MFSLIGFRHAIDMAGEARNPRVIVPAALILSLLICVVIYGALQLAFLGAVPSSELADGWHQLNLGHDLGPLGALATTAGMLWLVSLLNASAVVSPFGGALVAVGSNARLALAMARNGAFPRVLQAVSARGVPVSALLLNLVVSTLVLVVVPFNEAVALNSAAIVLSFALGPIAVVVLRRRLPHAPRGFRLPWVRLFAAAAFVVTTLVIYWTGWATLQRLLWILIAGLAWFGIRQVFAKSQALHLRQAGWLLPWLIGLGLISWLGGFGGGRGVLAFGWDLLACTVLALGVYVLAIRQSLSQTEFDRELEAAAHEEGVPDV